MNLHSILTLNAYSDEQPRDNDGKWTDGPDKVGRGDVLPRNQYDEKRNSAVIDYLKKQGFTRSGVNSDPHAPITFKRDVDKGPATPQSDPKAAGHSTHSVLVYPNGEWEHTSESSHSGYGPEGLGFMKTMISIDSSRRRSRRKK